MERIPTVIIRGVIPAVAATVLAGCGGGNSAACDVLTEDTRTAATVFAPIIPSESGQEDVATQRLALLEKVDSPPADLKEEWEAWIGYLEEVKAQPNDFQIALKAASDPDLESASDSLADFYTGECL